MPPKHEAPKGGNEIRSIIKEVIKAEMSPINTKLDSIIDDNKAFRDRLTKVESDGSKLKSDTSKILGDVKLPKADIHSNAIAIDALEQYGRRNAVRINNVRVESIPSSVRKVRDSAVTIYDTDQFVINLADRDLHIELNAGAISRSHIVGKIKNGKCQIIVKFVRYNTRRVILEAKGHLKHNVDGIFITEDLTKVRYTALRNLAGARRDGKIFSYWSRDGNLYYKLNDASKPVKVDDPFNPVLGLVRAPDVSMEM